MNNDYRELDPEIIKYWESQLGHKYENASRRDRYHGLLSLEDKCGPNGNSIMHDHVPSNALNPELKLMKKEDRRSLQDAIAGLSTEEQEFLTLLDDNENQKRVAECMGISPAAVSKKKKKIYKKLRKRLPEERLNFIY